MSITKSSLFVRLFLAVWLGLKNAAANSVLGRACDRLQDWACLLYTSDAADEL